MHVAHFRSPLCMYAGHSHSYSAKAHTMQPQLQSVPRSADRNQPRKSGEQLVT